MTKRRNRGAPPQSRMTRSGPAPKPSGRQPIRKQATVARNAPCPCGSGAKYKKCHGKPKPAPSRVLAPYQTFASQYDPAQQQAVLDFVARWGFNPNLTQLQMFMENDVDGLTAMISGGLARIDDNEKFVFAVRKLHRLITPKNQSLVSDDAKEEWEAALAEYDERHRITDDSSETGPGSPQGVVRSPGAVEGATAAADA